MTSSRRTTLGLGLALLALGLLAPVLPKWALFLVTIAIGKGLTALGLLLLMRTGLVSFGQGLYFATGAYAAGVASDAFHVGDAVLMVLLGGLAAALVAAVLGLLLARYRAIFFAMLSLAFSMILYGLLVKTSALGSTDGFNVAPRTVFGVAAGSALGRYGVYAIAALVAFGSAVGLDRYLGTYLGRLAPAIRDNELRVEYMGASVRNVVHLNLVIAALLAGMGGAITALAVGHIDPEMAYWTTSGEFVFVAILSGTTSVAAPFAGALLLELLRSFAYEHAPNTWQLVMGSTMLAVILFLPDGLWSIFPAPAEGLDVSAILEVTGLVKSFGAVTAARDIHVSIDPDSVVGLIGGNGAGKTTFLNLVTGYLKPTAGTIRFQGRDITGMAPRRITRLGMCRSFQIPQVFDTLTAYENLLVGLGIVSMGRRSFVGSQLGDARPETVAEETLERFRLSEYRDEPASVLPEGIRKLLDIAMALAVKPSILLLDEPTSGVSADEKFALMDLVLGAIRADKVTVLFVEHDMDIVRRYTQRILAFYDGKVIADGDSATVLANPEVRRLVVGEPAPEEKGAAC